MSGHPNPRRDADALIRRVVLRLRKHAEGCEICQCEGVEACGRAQEIAEPLSAFVQSLSADNEALRALL